MKVVILCGGKGTRLREETEFRPKPMVPIGGRPILWHIMKHYARFGHTEFVLCLGYKGEMIREFFRNYRWNLSDVTVSLGARFEARFHGSHGEEDWEVTLAETGLDSMTGYRLRLAAPHLRRDEPFLLTYGDGVSDVDLDALLACHRSAGKLVTITAVRPAGRFGAMVVEEDGSISTFEEKPQSDESYVNGGFMVCEPGLLGYLSADPGEMLERGPILRLAGEGQLNAYRHPGFWQPMDTYQEMQHLNTLWDSGRAPWARET